MGCNTSQEQISASNIDVRDTKSSGVTKLLDDNENQKISSTNGTELIVEEYGQDEEFAATKIQAAFRGHQTRAAMKNADNDTTTKTTNNKPTPAEPAAAATKADNTETEPTKEELEAEFDPNDKELCDAAMKIQATFRGHLQRKIVSGGDKDDIDVDIQEITKKVAEELDIDLTDPELNKAATKIQASFRGHKTRKQDQ